MSLTWIGQLRTPVKLALAIVIVGILIGIYTLVPRATKAVASAKIPGVSTAAGLFVGNKDEINVCVNTWGGFAGAQWYNGGFEPSDKSRFKIEKNLTVRFTKMDDFDGSRAALKSGDCHLIWATVDSFVAEAEGLSGEKPVPLFQVDWSRGGDVVVAARDIQKVNDLKGRKLGVAFGTPSHSLLLWLLNSSGISPKELDIIKMKDEPAVVAATKANELGAGILWSPDDADIVSSTPGMHVLTSTKQATDIIADTLLVKAEYLATHRDELTRLYEGWMLGNAAMNTNPQAFREAVQITATGYGQTPEFMETAMKNVRFTTHGDNKNFYGLVSGYNGMKADELYTKTGMLYQETGYVTGFPSWRTVADTSVIANAKGLDGPEQRAEAGRNFEPAPVAVQTAAAVTSKPVIVTFPVNSSVLDEKNKSIIDKEVVNLLKQFKTSYIRIEGNTDVTGNPLRNQELSLQRARSVAAYLAETYHAPVDRFIQKGNGSAKPVCTDDTPDCYARNRRTEFQVVAEN